MRLWLLDIGGEDRRWVEREGEEEGEGEEGGGEMSSCRSSSRLSGRSSSRTRYIVVLDLECSW